MAQKVDFYFDVSSPYSYLAAIRLGRLADSSRVSVIWKPFLLGGVFQSVGNVMPAALPARGRYLLKDLERWAKQDHIPFTFSSSFPHNSLTAMRALTAAEPHELKALSLAIFRGAWVENRNISEPDVLMDLLGERGPVLVTKSQDTAIKDKLKATTQTALDCGAFGAPSFVVDGELFWGNDRLQMALRAAQSDRSEGS